MDERVKMFEVFCLRRVKGKNEKQINKIFFVSQGRRLPWRSSGWDVTFQCRGARLIPWLES